MAVEEDLDIKVGDTFWSKRWAVLVSNAPVDLTDGWTVRAQIRPAPGSLILLHEFSGTGVLVTAPVTDEEAGTTVPSTVQLYIPAATTATFTEWVGAWDLEIEHPTAGLGGVPYRKTVLAGIARTTWDVTRS
jgi:hypothetical protein